MQELINKKFTYAVVGASANESKYGHKVFKYLLESGFKVIPINPKAEKILSVKAFASLSQVKEPIDVVVFVTQPQVTEQVLAEAKKLKLKKFWLQPGAENEQCLMFCHDHDLNCVHHACIMVQSNLQKL